MTHVGMGALGNVANQKYELRKKFARYIHVIKHTPPSRETARWREPLVSVHVSRLNTDKNSVRIQQLKRDNLRMSQRLHEIVREDRQRRSYEYAPGWRAGLDGAVIDCYTSKPYHESRRRFDRNNHMFREKIQSKITNTNVKLYKYLQDVKSSYEKEKYKKQYEENRRLYKFFSNKTSTTALHLGLIKAAKKEQLRKANSPYSSSKKFPPEKEVKRRPATAPIKRIFSAKRQLKIDKNVEKLADSDPLEAFTKGAIDKHTLVFKSENKKEGWDFQTNDNLFKSEYNDINVNKVGSIYQEKKTIKSNYLQDMNEKKNEKQEKKMKNISQFKQPQSLSPPYKQEYNNKSLAEDSSIAEMRERFPHIKDFDIFAAPSKEDFDFAQKTFGTALKDLFPNDVVISPTYATHQIGSPEPLPPILSPRIDEQEEKTLSRSQTGRTGKLSANTEFFEGDDEDDPSHRTAMQRLSSLRKNVSFTERGQIKEKFKNNRNFTADSSTLRTATEFASNMSSFRTSQPNPFESIQSGLEMEDVPTATTSITPITEKEASTTPRTLGEATFSQEKMMEPGEESTIGNDSHNLDSLTEEINKRHKARPFTAPAKGSKNGPRRHVSMEINSKRKSSVTKAPKVSALKSKFDNTADAFKPRRLLLQYYHRGTWSSVNTGIEQESYYSENSSDQRLLNDANYLPGGNEGPFGPVASTYVKSTRGTRKSLPQGQEMNTLLEQFLLHDPAGEQIMEQMKTTKKPDKKSLRDSISLHLGPGVLNEETTEFLDRLMKQHIIDMGLPDLNPEYHPEIDLQQYIAFEPRPIRSYHTSLETRRGLLFQIPYVPASIALHESGEKNLNNISQSSEELPLFLLSISEVGYTLLDQEFLEQMSPEKNKNKEILNDSTSTKEKEETQSPVKETGLPTTLCILIEAILHTEDPAAIQRENSIHMKESVEDPDLFQKKLNYPYLIITIPELLEISSKNGCPEVMHLTNEMLSYSYKYNEKKAFAKRLSSLHLDVKINYDTMLEAPKGEPIFLPDAHRDVKVLPCLSHMIDLETADILQELLQDSIEIIVDPNILPPQQNAKVALKRF